MNTSENKDTNSKSLNNNSDFNENDIHDYEFCKNCSTKYKISSSINNGEYNLVLYCHNCNHTEQYSKEEMKKNKIPFELYENPNEIDTNNIDYDFKSDNTIEQFSDKICPECGKNKSKGVIIDINKMIWKFYCVNCETTWNSS